MTALVAVTGKTARRYEGRILKGSKIAVCTHIFETKTAFTTDKIEAIRSNPDVTGHPATPPDQEAA